MTGYGARTTPLHAGMTGYGTQHGGLRRAAPCDKKTRNYQTKPKKRGKKILGILERRTKPNRCVGSWG
jgi:hypothetical protein